MEDAMPEHDNLDELPPPRKGPRNPPPERTSAAAEAISQADDRSVYDWLQEIGSGAVLRITLTRVSPKEWVGTDGQRHLVAGYLDEFDYLITENEIKTRFGGGRFQVKVYKPGPKGNRVYAGARTFEIQGDPKLTGEAFIPTGGGQERMEPNAGDVSLQRQALSAMTQQATDAQKRAWQIEDEMRRGRNQGIDTELLKAMSDPMKEQVRSMESRFSDLSKQLAEKDKQLLDIVTRKPEATFQDRILEKMVDSESVRIEAIRVRHDSELRQLRQSNADDLKASREHLNDELKQRERAHERELDTMKSSLSGQIDSLKSSHEARVDGLKGRISDLERQLTEGKIEITELRTRKEKGSVEMMQEIAVMKNGLEALGMSNPEGNEGSIWERLLGTALESPLAKAVAARVEQAPPAQQPQAQQPRRRVITPEQRAAAQRAARAAASQGATPEQQMQAAQQAAAQVAEKPKKPKKKGPPQLDPVEVVTAVALMEASVRNGTDPAVFAASVRSMIPRDILDRIREQGIDKFLTETAKLDPGSPLATQMGRNFMRKVARILLEGAEMVAEAAPAPVPEPPVDPTAPVPAEQIIEEMKVE